MKPTYRISLVFAAALAAAGCLDLELGALSGPAGTYVLDKASMEKAIYSMAETQLEQALVLQPQERHAELRDEFRRSLEESKPELSRDLEKMDVQLTLAEDGTWTRVAKDGKTPEETEAGTWELRGESLVLTTREKGGHTLAAPETEEAAYRPGEISFRLPGTPLEAILRRV